MPEDPVQPETPAEIGAEDLSDEIAEKYAPERLLTMVGKKAGRGEALDASLRAKYEKKLGADLSHVRIFSGEFAEEFNRKREAYAVTVGATGMILMGGSPDRHRSSAAGEALLAHELTHVAQARGGLHRDATYKGEFTSAHEMEAEEFQAQMHAELTGMLEPAGKSREEKEEARDAAIEKIRERVMEMATDAARNHGIRGGSNRRA